MGVYIKGMEMPQNCGICGFKDGCEFSIPLDKRPSDCPLVPVSPHGRLIDADAFAADMKKRQDACAKWCDDIKNGCGYGTELYYRADSFWGAMCETKLTLDKMPTIIPADKDCET